MLREALFLHRGMPGLSLKLWFRDALLLRPACPRAVFTQVRKESASPQHCNADASPWSDCVSVPGSFTLWPLGLGAALSVDGHPPVLRYE